MSLFKNLFGNGSPEEPVEGLGRKDTLAPVPGFKKWMIVVQQGDVYARVDAEIPPKQNGQDIVADVIGLARNACRKYGEPTVSQCAMFSTRIVGYLCVSIEYCRITPLDALAEDADMICVVNVGPDLAVDVAWYDLTPTGSYTD